MEIGVEIGSRCVADDIHFGTVKYFGPVPPTAGAWIGVEWDDETRGKHNGIHEGIRYFDTKKPTSGSFVRDKKVHLGVNFCDAVARRYSNDVQDGNFIFDVTNRPVEMVGMEKIGSKQSRFDKLKVVVLHNEKVSNAGPEGQIESQTPNIEELDVSKNLLCSWKAVASITKQLKRLKSLNISDNRLSLPANHSELEVAFQTVRTLTMNNMTYNWNEIAELSRLWPRVDVLSVARNNITNIDITGNDLLQNLVYLDLSYNHLQCNKDFVNLGLLPKLETLILTFVGLKKIEFTGTLYDEKTELFAALQTLWLNNNNIGEWQSITELNKLSKLSALHFAHNPIGNDDVHIIIAKISSLTCLGGTMITAVERRGAELDYLKMHGEYWLRCKESEDMKQMEEFNCAHPRFEELIKKYGPPEKGECIAKPRNLKSNLISLLIYNCMDIGKPPINKKLPKSITVQKLKGLLHKLLKPPCDAFQLNLSYICEQKNPSYEHKIDNDYRQLGYFAVEDGDKLMVRW